MKILLDTNALVWWLADDRKLGRSARRRLADPRVTVIANIVSLWELTLKHRAGKFNRSGTTLLPIMAGQKSNCSLSACRICTSLTALAWITPIPTII